MKRILYVSPLSGMAGAERVLYNIVRELNREKFIPEVVVPGDGPLFQLFLRDGIRIHQRGLTRWIIHSSKYGYFHLFSRLLRLPWNVLSLVRLIKGNKIDLVHTNTITVIDGALAAWLCGVPHIWHIHEMLPETTNLKSYLPLRIVYWIISKLSNLVIVVSRAVQDNIFKVYPISNIHVIHNGISFERVSGEMSRTTVGIRRNLGIPDDAFCIAIVGSIIPIKGHSDLIDALSLIITKVPSLHLLVIGDTQDKEYLEKIQSTIEKYDLISHVHFIGYRDDVLEIIHELDAIVVPSKVDSFPTVALEAMMLAKPIVATRSGGIEEIIEDGVTGFLVPPGDCRALSDKLLLLAQNRSLAKYLGLQGKKHVEKALSLSRFIREIEDSYLSVLNLKQSTV